jgi:phage FluMu protein Com
MTIAPTKPQKATITHKPAPRLREYRCAERCGRLLFRGHLPPGAEVEIRCPRCHRTRTFYGPTNGKTEEDTA